MRIHGQGESPAWVGVVSEREDWVVQLRAATADRLMLITAPNLALLFHHHLCNDVAVE